MKRITLITLMLALGISVYAQKPTRPHPAKLPTKLEADLKLTPDQQTKVADILKDRNFEMDSLAKRVNIRNGKFIETKMKDEMVQVNGKVYAVLNPDQKLIYAQYVLNRKEQMGKPRKPKSPAPAAKPAA